MQFFTVTNQSSVKHKILVVPLNQNEMNQVLGQCQQCMPSIFISALTQNGHPYVIVDFGGADSWKTAIALDEKSEDGDRIGDELALGDVLNVILVADKNALKVSGEKVYLNVPVESIIGFSFIYTADMAENYALHKMYTQPKAE